MRAFGRHAMAFLVAVAATAAVSSVVQTQINLSRLTGLGATVPPDLRALTTLQDVAFFGPVMAAITAAAFLPAFAGAWLISRAVPSGRFAIHALAGVVGLWAAFQLMGFVTPMPTLVAAARTQAGFAAMSLTGLIGGALFARASRIARSRHRRTSP
jgi:hypothetical protein